MIEQDRVRSLYFRNEEAYRFLAIGSAVIIFILLSLPGQWIEAVQFYIYSWWSWPASELVPSEFPTDKIVHAFMFLLCAALFVRGWSVLRKRWYLVCVVLILYGMLTEVMQHFIPGRSASLGDLVADSIGVGIGIMIALAFKEAA